jgi:ribosome-associated translation inhibitor RaiA
MVREPVIQIAVVRGEVEESTLEYARKKVGAVLRLAPAPVLFARVSLAHESGPGMQRPVVVKASLDVNGRPVRAHVAAGIDTEAIDLLEAKLRHGLETLAEKRQARRHEPAEVASGQWRHGALPTTRPEWFPRPVADREVVRRKSYLLQEQTVAEAALDLDVLDQDWVLFTELGTGADALLAVADGGYRLTIATDEDPDVSDVDRPVDVRLDVPRMDLATALGLLEEADLRLVFFIDADSGRGMVAYRRYDGHYGTVTGADQPTETAPELDRRPA